MGRLPRLSRARARAIRPLIESSPRRCMPAVLPVRHGAGLSGPATGRWRVPGERDPCHPRHARDRALPNRADLPAGGGEGQERYVSRSLDRNRQRTLVSGAGAKLAPRLDLASLRDVAAQARGIFVIDLPDLVDAESADLAPSAEAAATTPPRSAPAAARATRATRTTPATRTAPAARTVTPARTLALGTPSEPRPRRFAIWTASAVPYSPLSGFVVAHIVLVFPLPHLGGNHQCRVTLRTATRYVI
jgi:hypothetical protein